MYYQKKYLSSLLEPAVKKKMCIRDSLISKWNGWVEDGLFEIVQLGNNYYDIEPNLDHMAFTR